ncbi:Uncharacterized protein TCM_046111 [Theobroma cacao]|uniref:Uncharacterized protein n=1 Tax=Theobroma cacao TaxID=3641 RepID=S1RWK1_THECC|nr:Uncharacterized protein TCM_046111 [Theobroma cacao]
MEANNVCSSAIVGQVLIGAYNYENWKACVQNHLSRNLLSCEIPSSLGNLLRLERLNLSFNRLQGEVPSSLGKLTSLNMLNLSNNHLQGALPFTFSGFPLSSFSGNDKLCGPPLSSCMDLTGHEKNKLSNSVVICIIVAIVFTSAVIYLVLICIMLRIWCNWRKVSISNSEGAGIEQKREEEKWVCGDEKKRKGEYWRVNSMALVPSQKEHISSSCIFHVKMDTQNHGK